jgi:hypothetical protein
MRIWVFVAAALVGTAAHFLYEPLGRPRLLVMFLPVNESPWEHVKLAVWPLLGAVAALTYWEGIPWPVGVTAAFAGVMHSIAAMLGLHYAVRFGLSDGTPILWTDILIYYLSLAGGWWIALGLLPAKIPPSVGAFCALCLLLLAVFLYRGSLRPPEAHLFQDQTKQVSRQRQ